MKPIKINAPPDRGVSHNAKIRKRAPLAAIGASIRM
jgi:hypothetical protein